MNLNDVRLFLRVVETSSFTAAAESLGIQKSTISRRINQLEDELGVRLLQRSTRKLKLTEEGNELFQRCLPLINELEQVPDHMSEQQGEARGRLKVAMPPEIIEDFMDQIISSFMLAHPQVELEIDLNSRSTDLIEDGIDLAIRIGKLSDSSLVARKLAIAEYGLFCSPTYAEAYGTPTTLEALRDHRCLMNVKPHDQWVFEHHGEQVIPNLKPQGRINSVLVLRQLVLMGNGIARIPLVYSSTYEASGQMVRILSNYDLAPVEVHALYPSRRHLNPKVRLFIDHTLDHLKRHHWVKAGFVSLPD